MTSQVKFYKNIRYELIDDGTPLGQDCSPCAAAQSRELCGALADGCLRSYDAFWKETQNDANPKPGNSVSKSDVQAG